MASQAQQFIQQQMEQLNVVERLNNINQHQELKTEYKAKVFKFLVDKAIRKETTCYEAIAQEVGLPTTGNQLSMTLSILLTDIFNWCEDRHLPMLTSIVVRKSGQDQGFPGKGFWKLVENKIKSKIKQENTIQIEKILLESRTVKSVLLQTYQSAVFEYWSMN